MEGQPNPKDEKIIHHINSTLEEYQELLQDEFERHERWLLNNGDISEVQYQEAVTAYRRANQAPNTTRNTTDR